MRQISVKYPCVSTYEKHETWVPYDSRCSLYLLPKRNMCLGTEEIHFFSSFCCFPSTLWSPSRAAGMRLGSKLQHVRFKRHRLEKRGSLAEFAAGFVGESKALYVTCSYLLHAPALLGCQNRKHRWKCGHTENNRARWQVEAENYLQKKAPPELCLSHWGKPWSFERMMVLDALNLSGFPLCSFSEVSTFRA